MFCGPRLECQSAYMAVHSSVMIESSLGGWGSGIWTSFNGELLANKRKKGTKYLTLIVYCFCYNIFEWFLFNISYQLGSKHLMFLVFVFI